MARRTAARWPWWAAGILATGALGWWLYPRKRAQRPRWTWGRPPVTDAYGETIHRDPTEVVPAFADKVETLLARMRARGFDPVVHEAWRSHARATRLAADGKGIVESLHTYGGAVDVVSASEGWSPPQAFWAALGEESERLGLTWGGTFGVPDRPHVQAVPPNKQQAFRAATPAGRSTMVG
jgi:hypothetical protein